MSSYGTGGYGYGTYGAQPIEMQPAGYYLQLLTSQYQRAKNFKAILLGILSILQDVAFFLAGVSQTFDVDYATGVQLDAIGGRVGLARVLPFQPAGGLSARLNDDAYRVLIRAKILRNYWDGTVRGIQDSWSLVFPGSRIFIQDNQDMSCNVMVTGPLTAILQQAVANDMVVPRRQGVRYNFTFSTLPVFGFDRNDEIVAGFDAGHWS